MGVAQIVWTAAMLVRNLVLSPPLATGAPIRSARPTPRPPLAAPTPGSPVDLPAATGCNPTDQQPIGDGAAHRLARLAAPPRIGQRSEVAGELIGRFARLPACPTPLARPPLVDGFWLLAGLKCHGGHRQRDHHARQQRTPKSVTEDLREQEPGVITRVCHPNTPKSDILKKGPNSRTRTFRPLLGTK